MASSTTFGATIVPKASQDLTLPPILDSPTLTPAASREGLSDDYADRRKVPPHSPFYQHPDSSFERVESRANSNIHVASNEKDLESGLAPLANLNEPFTSKVSVDCNKECRMWPSKQTLMESKQADKKKKREGQLFGGCGPVVDFWGRQTKKQKLIFKILLGLLIIGIVVAIAVGITVAVNGTVYVSDGHNEAIPDPNDSS